MKISRTSKIFVAAFLAASSLLAQAASPFEQNNQQILQMIKDASQGKVAGYDAPMKADSENQPLSTIQTVRQYRDHKIPAQVKEKIKFEADFKNWTPYFKDVPLANGKKVRILVRALPVYVIYKHTDGTTTNEILYPRKDNPNF